MNIFIDKPAIFSAKLQEWYNEHHRNLPWRNTTDPYKIWLSEIILQQTRVEQGTAYYNKFVDHYPTVSHLAKASEQKVLKDWQGLGYYSRARNLHAAAKVIYEQMNGVFPSTFTEIKKLKGVGDYTAAAISSFAFNEAQAVLDGNVFRVLSRLSANDTPIDTTIGKKLFQEMASRVLDNKNPAQHNQAIMEFGALQCLPKNPKCDTCIFQRDCSAFRLEKQQQLPVKAKKIKQRKRYFNYLIIENDDVILLNKRRGSGIWQNMYDFPLIESDKKLSLKKVETHEELKKLIKLNDFIVDSVSQERKHILSHQIILATFYHLKISSIADLNEHSFDWKKKSELVNFPIPKLIENYLQEETNLLSLFN